MKILNPILSTLPTAHYLCNWVASVFSMGFLIMSKTEIWKDIKGYEGLYKISSQGRVRSLIAYNKKRDIIMGLHKSGKENNDYFAVCLCKNRINKTLLVHRLVLINFKRHSLAKEECNHIDRNRFNNHIDNLEWVTSKQNSIHSRDNYSKAFRGEKHPRAKVTDQQALEIKRLGKRKVNYKIIAEKYNITVKNSMEIVMNNYKHLDHLI